MICSVIDVGYPEADTAVVENAGETVDDHVRQIRVYVHWDEQWG